MSKPQINPGQVPPARAPEIKRGRPDPEKYFTFSFRYWKERDHFGVDAVESSWFPSLLARLCELGKEKVTRFFDDPSFKDAIRSHAVNWDARNIPIQLDYLDWLPRSVRENSDELPLVQFHISKALGRVHGFWDENWCFQVVLLDPLHNLQPSKDVGYKVRPTTLAGCQYSALRVAIDRACDKRCSNQTCELSNELRALCPESVEGQTVVVAGMTEDVAASLAELRLNQPVSVSDIIEYGIEFWNEKEPDTTANLNS